MSIVVIGGCIITVLFFCLQRSAVQKIEELKGAPKINKTSVRLSLLESFNFLVESPYIRNLAILIVANGISSNLVEVSWKSKLKAQFPDPSEYSAFMGDFSTASGTTTLILMISSRFIIQKLGWGAASLITPFALLVTGTLFFALVLYSDVSAPDCILWGKERALFLNAAVIIGATQSVFSKGAKFSLFDPCKEMAYIPLDKETRTKGKAAIDVICNPIGKSGGAIVQQFLIITFGSLGASAPYLAAILMVTVGAWISAARSLDSQFNNANNEAV